MQTARSRSYCFTVNNPLTEVQDPHNLLDVASYLVFQLEEGENGTPHYQGYVHLKHAMPFTALRKYLEANYAIARGSASENFLYCTKEPRLDGPYEFGEKPSQGKRSDLLSVKAKIDDGASDQQIADEHFGSWCRYHKSFTVYRSIKTQKRTWKTVVNYYYGVSGSGKSFRAQNEAGENTYFKDPGNKWFDNYNCEPNVIFDDFRGNWFVFSTLLRILDAYPLQVEFKGGSVNFVARTIWITSNVAPDQLYPGISGIELQALLRRIENVVYFPHPFGFIPPAIE